MPRCVLPARGEPEAGESAEQTLTRELGEELGVMPTLLRPLGQVEEMAALENVPMRMTVFTARIGPDPRPAAELAALGWTNGVDGYARLLAPAVSGHVVPLRRSAGLLPGVSTREPGPRITSVVSANSAALPASSCR
jgi:8-oxo-dGTP diphosphatase